jgi:membrane-bound lytic murein transglycosylase D
MSRSGAGFDSDQSVDCRQQRRQWGLLLACLITATTISGCSTHLLQPGSGPTADAQAVDPDPGTDIAPGEGDAPGPDIAESGLLGFPTVWHRLRQDFRLTDIEHPRIDAEVRRLLHSPPSFNALLERARPYLAHITDTVEAAGLPGEIALLPAVESGFRPFAYSPDGAAGLWQFMPATGSMMGLHQDWWFDSRRTVRGSTSAATEYLQRLNGRFSGDWLHTLASYNAGAATVRRAIRRARKRGEPTDFWSLDLPGETDRYVPRLLALARVVNDPEKYGVSLPDIPDAPYFTIVTTDRQVDLNIAAQAAGLDVEHLILLNAGNRRWTTHPDGPHELLVPLSHADGLGERLAALPPEKRLRWQRHQVASGESLSVIARRYGVSVAAIRRTNQLPDARIRAGEELVIPLSDTVTGQTAGSNRLAQQRLRYKVRKGDSLYKIARRFQVTIKDLRRWNRVGRYIRPGEHLTVFIDPDA